MANCLTKFMLIMEQLYGASTYLMTVKLFLPVAATVQFKPGILPMIDRLQRTVLLPEGQQCALPKYVCHLSSGNLLIFNEDGHLFVFNRFHDNPYIVQSIYLVRYSMYCIMEVSVCRSYVCFASRDGYVTIYKGKTSYLSYIGYEVTRVKSL